MVEETATVDVKHDPETNIVKINFEDAMIKENWNLNNYQMQARKFAIYPERMKITYPALGLAGEAGEVADKVKKIHS